MVWRWSNGWITGENAESDEGGVMGMEHWGKKWTNWGVKRYNKRGKGGV